MEPGSALACSRAVLSKVSMPVWCPLQATGAKIAPTLLHPCERRQQLYFLLNQSERMQVFKNKARSHTRLTINYRSFRERNTVAAMASAMYESPRALGWSPQPVYGPGFDSSGRLPSMGTKETLPSSRRRMTRRW